MDGVVMIKRICGHSSPYTFKKNERFGKQRFEKFINKRCPACTIAAIQAAESEQKAESQRRKLALRVARGAAPKEALGDSAAARFDPTLLTGPLEPPRDSAR
ncbi:MAG TPA: hypothetical protein VFE24_00870 [Pirellulales bacterium]|nr:hypothetical protein [Pirellulales bacterium]